MFCLSLRHPQGGYRNGGQRLFVCNGSLAKLAVHKCSSCEKKRASSSGYLKRQIRVHSGEKPFHCDVCE